MNYNWNDDNNLVRKIAKILLSDTLPNGEPVSSMFLIDDASRAELECWANMTDEEFAAAQQRGDSININVDDELKRLEEEYGIDVELLAEIELWEESDHDEPATYHFSNSDPYLKPQPLLPDHVRHNCYFNEDGHLCVKNLSAFWIPELTVTEVIHGTTYIVTGSYEGEVSFLKKLERITAKKFTEKMEDSE